MWYDVIEGSKDIEVMPDDNQNDNGLTYHKLLNARMAVEKIMVSSDKLPLWYKHLQRLGWVK